MTKDRAWRVWRRCVVFVLLASPGCSLLISLDEVTEDLPADASVTIDANVGPRADAGGDVSLESGADVTVTDAIASMPRSDADNAREDAQGRAEGGPTEAGSCRDPMFPVACPAVGSGTEGGVPADCWSASTDCTSVTRCGTDDHACTTGRRYDCVLKRCVPRCTDQFPIFCPALGAFADGGTADDCWSTGTDCSTIKNCSSVLHACASGSVYDCASARCVGPARDGGTEAAPPIVCGGGQVACQGRCVDLQVDPGNCGTCSNACGGRSCVAGQCCSPPAAGGSCNLPACGCAASEVCYPDTQATGLACFPSSGLPEGANCDLDQHCAAGSGCFGGTCKKYCNTDTDCVLVDGARSCIQALWPDGSPIAGVTACLRVCDPVTPQNPRTPLLACPTGQGCRPGDASGVSNCFRQSGLGVAGAACASTSDCAVGHYCTVGDVCNKFCSSSADCATGSTCVAFVDPTFAGTYQIGFCRAAAGLP